MDPRIKIREVARENGFNIGEEDVEKLHLFATYFLLWNKNINLISRNDESKIWNRHILASLSVLFFRSFVRPATILDLGTGGGFPGIPLAICLPDCKFLLMDSIQKKIIAVNDMLLKLQLTNVTTLVGRAEELGTKNGLHKNFDYVIARAIGPTKEIIRWGVPFLKSTERAKVKESFDRSEMKSISPGSLVLMKGGNLEEEMKEVQNKYHPRSVEIVPVTVKGIDAADFVD